MTTMPKSMSLSNASGAEVTAPRCIEILGGNVRLAEALLLGGLEVLLVARPAGTGGGGDIYCIHSCGHGALAKFVLLDLTGHGQERDAIARTVHELLHRHTDETRPAQVLKLLNEQYTQLNLRAVLATGVSAVYEPGRNRFHFSNAGHPRPLHWSAKQRGWSVVEAVEESTCGLPLGIRPDACYTEESIAIAEGDMLFLSSDGLQEARTESDEFLEPEGILRLLEESSSKASRGTTVVEMATDFLLRLEEFHGSKEFEDDITLLWLRRLPPAA